MPDSVFWKSHHLEYVGTSSPELPCNSFNQRKFHLKIGKSTPHTSDSFSDPFTRQSGRLRCLRLPRTRNASATGLSYSMSSPAMGQADQKIPLLNLASMFEKDVQSLWQRALEVSQYMPLRFWSKGRPSLTENYSQLEKQMTGPC